MERKDYKVNASKENARKAHEILNQPHEIGTANRFFLEEFLAACAKRLPSEASYMREYERRQLRYERERFSAERSKKEVESQNG